MIIQITPRHIELLKEKRIFLNSAGNFDSTWLKIGARYDTTGKAFIESYSAFYSGPKLSSVGAFSYTQSCFPPSVFRIGRYCAIAARSQMIPTNHPTSRLSSCGFDYAKSAPYKFFEEDHGLIFEKESPNINAGSTDIGNDVWIGQEVMIKRGIKIGHGAVVAARSVVTKDVPPYAVVAGSPAVIKKYRFEPAVIERLLKSNWWNYSYKDFFNLNTKNPIEFLDEFEKLVQKGEISPMEENRIDMHAEFRKIAAA